MDMDPVNVIQRCHKKVHCEDVYYTVKIAFKSVEPKAA